MRKLFLIVLLFSAYNSFCQQSFPDVPGTLLWGIINSKGDTSYLFGTFHEFGNTFFDKYSTTKKKYKRAECIVVESLPNEAGSVKITENWVARLSREDYKLINAYLKKMDLGYSLKMLRNVPQAWIEYMILSELLKRECNIKDDKDVVGIDEYIMNGAISHNKKLLGLESALDTFNVVNTMMGAKSNTNPNGVLELKDIIVNEKSYLDTIRTKCWEAENYRTLQVNYKFGQPSVADDPDFKNFLDRRNEAWLPNLKNIIDNNRAFIAVGLKHLFYQNGLIEQLVNSGYTVFPVPMPEKAK